MSADRRGEPSVDEPHVVYQGRIATVMRRLQSEGIERTLRRLQALSALDPNLADHVDIDTTFRIAARLDGVPEQVLRSRNSVRRMRRQREAEAAAAQKEAEAAMAGADATPAPTLPV